MLVRPSTLANAGSRRLPRSYRAVIVAVLASPDQLKRATELEGGSPIGWQNMCAVLLPSFLLAGLGWAGLGWLGWLALLSLRGRTPALSL